MGKVAVVMQLVVDGEMMRIEILEWNILVIILFVSSYLMLYVYIFI